VKRIMHTARRISVRRPVTRDAVVAMRNALARFATPGLLLAPGPDASESRSGVASVADVLLMFD
jgi:hypothetical protein